jgi:hypothetical protein
MRFREHRIVAGNRADVVPAGYVGGGQHSDDTRRSAHSGQVHSRNPGVSLAGIADLHMKQPCGLGNIVNVNRLAADMLRAAIVAAKRADATVYCGSCRRQWLG